MTEKETPDERFDHSIKRLTQFPVFMDAFTARAVSSIRSTGPVANFVCTRMDKTADKWRLRVKAEGFPQPNNVSTWHFTLLPFKSNEETDHQNQCNSKHKSSTPSVNDLQAISKRPYSTASSDQYLAPPHPDTTDPHQIFQPTPATRPSTAAPLTSGANTSSPANY